MTTHFRACQPGKPSKVHLPRLEGTDRRDGLRFKTFADYAKYMAASLAYIILRQRDSVRLAVFDD